jgi:hypothetical protein
MKQATNRASDLETVKLYRNRRGLRSLEYFFISLLYNPEHGGDIFLRNISLISTNYTALYSRS